MRSIPKVDEQNDGAPRALIAKTKSTQSQRVGCDTTFLPRVQVAMGGWLGA